MLHFLNFLINRCLPSPLYLRRHHVHLPLIRLKLLLKGRNQGFVLQVELVKYSVEVLLDDFRLLDVFRFILIKFLEEQPHLAHVVGQLKSGLVLVLLEVSFYDVHVHYPVLTRQLHVAGVTQVRWLDEQGDVRVHSQVGEDLRARVFHFGYQL